MSKPSILVPKAQTRFVGGRMIFITAVLVTISLLGCAGVGEVEVSSIPQGADVYLDDSLTGLSTNCVLTEVPSGEHNIKLVLGDKEYEEEVKVKTDQTTVVTAEFSFEENELVWVYETGSLIKNCPAVGNDGSVIFVTTDGYINSVKPSGSLGWQKKLGASLLSAPTVDPDGNVYVSSDTVILMCLDIQGNLLWQYTDSMLGGRVRASAAIGEDGTIYALTDTLYPKDTPFDTLYPYDRLYVFKKDGALKSCFEKIAVDNCSSPAFSAGTLYFGSKKGEVRALTIDGVLKWKCLLSGSVLASPAIGSDGTVFLGVFSNASPTFYALNSNGEIVWNLRLYGSTSSSPAVGPDGTIYFNTDNGYIYAVSSTGEEKWSYLHNGKGYSISSPAIGADGTIYTATGDSEGKFYVLAFSPDGTLLWSYEVPQAVSDLTISPEGFLYCPSGGSLYAFYIGQGLASSPWPKFQHDARNTGRFGVE